MLSETFFVYLVVSVTLTGLAGELYVLFHYRWEIAVLERNPRPDTSILSKGNVRSPFHFIPALLTALGIIGTFWGIYQGFAEIDLNSLNEIATLLDAATTLLSGMKTAFQSSLWGLGAASAFILVLAIAEGLRGQWRRSALRKLRSSTPRDRSGQLLDRLGVIAEKMEGLATLNAREIGREVAAELQPTSQLQALRSVQGELSAISENTAGLATLDAGEIGREVAAALAPSLQVVGQEISEQNQAIALHGRDLKTELGTLSGNLAIVLNELHEKLPADTSDRLSEIAAGLGGIGRDVALALTPSLQVIRDDLDAQRQAIEQQRQELLTTLVGELRTEAIEPVLIRLDESASLTREASTAVKELKVELGGISLSLASSIQTIQRFQEDTLDRLQGFALNLQEILDRFRTDTRGVMEQIAIDIQNVVDESVVSLEAQRNAFAESSDRAATTFRGIRSDLQAALSTQAEQQRTMLQEVQTSTERILDRTNSAFIEQTNALTRVGSEASGMITTASENLNATLGNIDGMLQQTRQTVQTELEKFRIAYQDSLTSFFDRQSNLLEVTLDRQRDGLERSIRELQQVFQEDAKTMAQNIIESMEKIETTTESVQTLANTTGLTSAERLEQVRAIANTLGDEAEKIERAYDTLFARFNEGLEIWSRELVQYFEQTNATYVRGREESERAAASICSQLNETSHGLMSVAEYLVAAANDIRNSRDRT